ncbi:UPF0415 protein C7orf25-like protein [Gryllus bimaculatus]|nr:UPF0415 protein C7orf25-like protein [Gryllus bimaculatus]
MEHNLEQLYMDKIKEADELMDLLRDLSNIKGVSKLKKLILAERTFLHKVAASKTIQAKHLTTTNLIHFKALISTVFELEKCVAVLEPFTFKIQGNLKRIVVDIVKDEGKEWVKVTARNPKGLMMSCLGDTNYGSRTIFDQAKDFIKCASQNPIFYVPPKVIFKFSSGVDSALATKISNVGIEVIGDLLPTTYNTVCDSSDEESEEEENCDLAESTSHVLKDDDALRKPILKLNLDITTLIAYVSDMTNGGTCVKFIQEPLTLQAQSERKTKVKDMLNKLFEGKELYCCETAMTRFKEILAVVGGENEKKRAEQFLQRITVVPDCVSERVKNLKNSGQIKDKPKIVFGTGDSMQAVTVSANWGFFYSAQHQGVQLTTHLHEPRALSEQASIRSQHCQEGS